MSTSDSRLSRRLGVGDAVVVGLGAMIGSGVFVAWQPAAARAGAWLLAGLALAALVAACNATSTAWLAAVYPQAGGAYHYGRRRLGQQWGALAGYAFIAGKTASCATAALAVGAYLWPQRADVVAVAAVIVMAAVNLTGVTKTARVTGALVALVILVLTVVVVAGLMAGPASAASDDPLSASADGGPAGVLGAAAVLFYAFAGYARITVLAEEVREPSTIPRAVAVSLAGTLAIYAVVGVTVLTVLGADGAAHADQPLRAVAEAAGGTWLVVAVAGGAAVAALSALTSLLAGVGRTSFAMAADGDLPPALAAVHPTRKVPRRAELAAAAATILMVLAGDLTTMLAASAFAVLVYYAVANAAAWRLPDPDRRWPRVVAAGGFVSCGALAFALPWQTVLIGSATLAGAMLIRAAVVRRRR